MEYNSVQFSGTEVERAKRLSCIQGIVQRIQKKKVETKMCGLQVFTVSKAIKQTPGSDKV